MNTPKCFHWYFIIVTLLQRGLGETYFKQAFSLVQRHSLTLFFVYILKTEFAFCLHVAFVNLGFVFGVII